MATRYYFSANDAAPQSLGFAAWAQTNSVVKRALILEKTVGETLVLGLQQLTTVGSLRCDRQYVSPSVVATTFLNGQVNLQIACREFNAGDNTVTAMALRVVTASGTVRGTMLAATKWFGVTSELINNATLRNMACASGRTTTSVTALPNDRLVVEIGFGDNAGATPEFQARYGAPSAISDHGQNMTETTSLVPWFEFVNNYPLLFTLPPTLRTQNLSEAASVSDNRFSSLGMVRGLLDSVEGFDSNRFGRFMLGVDNQETSDGFMKAQRASILEVQDGSDTPIKNLTKRTTETLVLSDVARGVVPRCVANVFVSAIRNRNGIDDVFIADALTKLVAKIIAERQDVFDSATTQIIVVTSFILRSISDTLDVSDGIRKLLGMNQQDAQQSSEAFNKLLSKNLTDVEKASDVLSKQLRKVIGELQHVSDTVSSSLLRVILSTDNQAVRDEFAKLLGKSIADNQATSDGFARLLIKLVSDGANITDAATLIKLAVRQFLDNAEVSDAILKILSKRIPDVADSLDALTKLLSKISGDIGNIRDDRMSSLSKGLTDRQDVFDSVSLNKIVGLIVLAIADALHLSDAQTKTLLKVVGEPSEVADAANKLLRSIVGDSATLTDATSKSWFKTLVDSAIASDNAALILSRVMAVADTLNIGDEFRKMLRKVSDDAAGLSDVRASMLSKMLGDIQGVTDQATLTTFAIGLILLAISDALDLSDSQRKSLFKNIGESEAFIDTPISMLSKSMTERQDVSDAVSVNTIVGLILLAIMDSLDISDRFSKSLAKNIAETEPYSDGFVKALSKSVGDTPEVRDAFSSAFSKVIGDQQGAADVFALALTKVLTESTSLSDNQNKLLRKVLSDLVEMTDSVALQKLTQLVLLELVETQDLRDDFVKSLFKVVNETYGLSDSVTSRIVEIFARFFIDSMVAASDDVFGQTTGSKTGIRLFTDAVDSILSGSKNGLKMVADDDDILNILTGAKGKRLK